MGRGRSSMSKRGTFTLSLRSGGTKRVTGRIISSGGQKLGIHKSDVGREWYIADVTTGVRIAGGLGEFPRLKDAMNYVNSDKGKAMIREYSEIKTKLKGREKSKIGSNKPIEYNGKIYKDIGNAKLSKPKRLTDWGTSTSRKRKNPLLESLPEINKVPKGWVAVEGDGVGGNVPAGYALISNNKSRFGGKRETALIKYEKAKKAGII